MFFFFFVYVCFFFFFFFFKQKTAYEIYQCDWSSDVCSSDLRFFYLWSKREGHPGTGPNGFPPQTQKIPKASLTHRPEIVGSEPRLLTPFFLARVRQEARFPYFSSPVSAASTGLLYPINKGLIHHSQCRER